MVNKYNQPVKKHYINLLVTKYVDSLKLEEHQIVHFCARKPQKKTVSALLLLLLLLLLQLLLLLLLLP